MSQLYDNAPYMTLRQIADAIQPPAEIGMVRYQIFTGRLYAQRLGSSFVVPTGAAEEFIEKQNADNARPGRVTSMQRDLERMQNGGQS